ncbi:hypothetical protein HK405_012657 [Cladochytrium tenue]|nr:hypothetical protein HK405_012657 [Cladochytrium tenue]
MYAALSNNSAVGVSLTSSEAYTVPPALSRLWLKVDPAAPASSAAALLAALREQLPPHLLKRLPPPDALALHLLGFRLLPHLPCLDFLRDGEVVT